MKNTTKKDNKGRKGGKEMKEGNEVEKEFEGEI